nr:MAG TPA: hypothetical protein [Caudoviricetes sp.]
MFYDSFCNEGSPPVHSLEVILRAKALRSNFYSKAPAGSHSSQKSVTDSVTDSMSNQK